MTCLVVSIEGPKCPEDGSEILVRGSAQGGLLGLDDDTLAQTHHNQSVLQALTNIVIFLSS